MFLTSFPTTFYLYKFPATLYLIKFPNTFNLIKFPATLYLIAGLPACLVGGYLSAQLGRSNHPSHHHHFLTIEKVNHWYL